MKEEKTSLSPNEDQQDKHQSTVGVEAVSGVEGRRKSRDDQRTAQTQAETQGR